MSPPSLTTVQSSPATCAIPRGATSVLATPVAPISSEAPLATGSGRSAVRSANPKKIAVSPTTDMTTIGSTDWVFGLAGDSLVGQVTRNVIDHGLKR